MTQLRVPDTVVQMSGPITEAWCSGELTPVNIQCYGCGSWMRIMQHVTTSAITHAACASCRAKWDADKEEP